MAISKIMNTSVYKFTKEVTIPGNETNQDIDLTNDIPNLSKMKGFDVGFSYGDQYWHLSIVRKIMDRTRPMVYLSNSSPNAVTHTLQIVVFY